MFFTVFTWQSRLSVNQGKIATPNRGENIRDLARNDKFGISFSTNFLDAIALLYLFNLLSGTLLFCIIKR
jgi:hypothetical protein